jgi:hypothetical protein
VSCISTSRGAPLARKIVGKVGEEYFLLGADEIFAFQADGDIVWIVTAKKRYMAWSPISWSCANFSTASLLVTRLARSMGSNQTLPTNGFQEIIDGTRFKGLQCVFIVRRNYDDHGYMRPAPDITHHF